MVLLASSVDDLQHALESFTVQCEVAGMGISTSKSEKSSSEKQCIACSGWWELLPQAREVKYLGVFMSDKSTEQEMDKWFGAASMVMQTLYWTTEVKKE